MKYGIRSLEHQLMRIIKVRFRKTALVNHGRIDRKPNAFQIAPAAGGVLGTRPYSFVIMW